MYISQCIEKYMDERVKTVILEYYKTGKGKKYVPIIHSIVTKKGPISLRTIEAFIMCDRGICKAHLNGQYKIKYDSYRVTYGKCLLDIFKRKSGNIQIFEYKYSGGSFETTVAQLNYFKMLIHNDILDVILNNVDEIVNDLKQNDSKKKIKVVHPTKQTSIYNNTIDSLDKKEKSLELSSEGRPIIKFMHQ